MTAITNAQSDTTTTEIKRQALKWFYERNECREILFISEQQNAAYQDLDSIHQLEINRLRSALTTQGEIITDQSVIIDKSEKKVERLKKQRNLFMGISVVVGAVLAVILL